MEPARGIDDNHRCLFLAGPFHGLLRNLHRIHVRGGGEVGHGKLLCQHNKLVNGRGAVDVCRHKVGAHLLLAQIVGNLGSRCGLARTLQADHHDDCRSLSLQGESSGIAAEKLNELLIDYADHLLLRRNAADHLLAQAFLAHLLNEAADDLVVYVGLEQSQADFAKPCLDVLLIECAYPAKGTEYVAESVGKTFKHN